MAGVIIGAGDAAAIIFSVALMLFLMTQFLPLCCLPVTTLLPVTNTVAGPSSR
jgi:hypothetical protein